MKTLKSSRILSALVKSNFTLLANFGTIVCFKTFTKRDNFELNHINQVKKNNICFDKRLIHFL